LELRRPHLSERRLLLLEMVLAVPALARVDLEICLEAQVEWAWKDRDQVVRVLVRLVENLHQFHSEWVLKECKVITNTDLEEHR